MLMVERQVEAERKKQGLPKPPINTSDEIAEGQKEKYMIFVPEWFWCFQLIAGSRLSQNDQLQLKGRLSQEVRDSPGSLNLIELVKELKYLFAKDHDLVRTTVTDGPTSKTFAGIELPEDQEIYEDDDGMYTYLGEQELEVEVEEEEGCFFVPKNRSTNKTKGRVMFKNRSRDGRPASEGINGADSRFSLKCHDCGSVKHLQGNKGCSSPGAGKFIKTNQEQRNKKKRERDSHRQKKSQESNMAGDKSSSSESSSEEDEPALVAYHQSGVKTGESDSEIGSDREEQCQHTVHEEDSDEEDFVYLGWDDDQPNTEEQERRSQRSHPYYQESPQRRESGYSTGESRRARSYAATSQSSRPVGSKREYDEGYNLTEIPDVRSKKSTREQIVEDRNKRHFRTETEDERPHIGRFIHPPEVPRELAKDK